MLEYLRRFKLRGLKLKFSLVIIFYLFFVIKSLIIFHPFQYIYYNILAGKEPLSKFDADYFGVSYKQALEYLLTTFPSDTLNLFCANPSGLINKINFSKHECSRLKFAEDISEADYYITNYYYPVKIDMYLKYKDGEFPFNQRMIFTKKFKNSKIIGIYCLK